MGNMGNMRIRKGNLLDLCEDGTFEYMMHGCNCFHAMGSGIAGTIAQRYPIVAEVDRRLTHRGSPSKLGDYTKQEVTTKQVCVPSEPRGWRDDELHPSPKFTSVTLDNPFTVINLYTQFNPGADFIPSIFPAAVQRINEDFAGKTIGIPLLGCGVGGGNWHKVMNDLLIHGSAIEWEVCVL